MTAEDQFYTSHIELSKSAFRNNIAFLKDYIGHGVTFCSVIKGNAYGHGIEQFVPMADDCGITHFAVFGADEARKAFHAKENKESHIMIMGMIGNETLGWAIENGISFFVFEIDRLKAAIEAAKKIGKKALIHLHLETGMNRLGIDPGIMDEVVNLIHTNSAHLAVEGLCTHYAGAESVSNHVRVTGQIKNFRKWCSWFEERGVEPKYRHTACSAAVLNYPDTTMDMVRVGIAQYGFWPNRETYMNFVKNHTDIEKEHKDPLKRVMSWKSEVMSTKEVEAGEFIGYGNVYLTSREQKIATVPIGYAHGFGRNLTNIGIVLIRGERASVSGIVNMNMLTVDVTDIPGVSKGDEVVIIGRQGGKEMTVSSFSEMADFLNYEVLVRIPSFIPRSIVS